MKNGNQDDDETLNLPIAVRAGASRNDPSKRDNATDCALLPIDNKRFVLLDSGCTHTAENIRKATQYYGREITGVILTHFDEDHCGGFDSMLSQTMRRWIGDQSEDDINEMNTLLKFDTLQHNFELLETDAIIRIFADITSNVPENDLTSAIEKIRVDFAKKKTAFKLADKLTSFLYEWDYWFGKRTYGWVQRDIGDHFSDAQNAGLRLEEFCEKSIECFKNGGKPTSETLEVAKNTQKLTKKVLSSMKDVEKTLTSFRKNASFAMYLLDHFLPEFEKWENISDAFEPTADRLFTYNLLMQIVELVLEQNSRGESFKICRHFLDDSDPACRCALCETYSGYKNRSRSYSIAVLSMLIIELPPSSFLKASKLISQSFSDNQETFVDNLYGNIQWIAYPSVVEYKECTAKLLAKIHMFMLEAGGDFEYVELTGDEASMYVYENTGKKVLPFHYLDSMLMNDTENCISVFYKRAKVSKTNSPDAESTENHDSPTVSYLSDAVDNDTSLLTIFHADKDKTKNILFTSDCSLGLIKEQINESLTTESTDEGLDNDPIDTRLAIVDAVRSCVKKKFHIFQLPNHGKFYSSAIDEESSNSSINYLLSVARNFYVSGAEEVGKRFPGEKYIRVLSAVLNGQGTIVSAYDYPKENCMVGLMGDNEDFKEIDVVDLTSETQPFNRQRPRSESESKFTRNVNSRR